MKLSLFMPHVLLLKTLSYPKMDNVKSTNILDVFSLIVIF
nr:MAG TPA: hypothetical protein [Caudoviricetes sp.]